MTNLWYFILSQALKGWFSSYYLRNNYPIIRIRTIIVGIENGARYEIRKSVGYFCKNFSLDIGRFHDRSVFERWRFWKRAYHFGLFCNLSCFVKNYLGFHRNQTRKVSWFFISAYQNLSIFKKLDKWQSNPLHWS